MYNPHMGVRRRILACVIALLLLGAIVNVAVAWGVSRWSPKFHWETEPRILSAQWMGEVPSGFEREPDNRVVRNAVGVSEFAAWGPMFLDKGSSYCNGESTIHSGLPFRSMALHCVRTSMVGAIQPIHYRWWEFPGAEVNGIWLPEGWRNDDHLRGCVLPSILVWPGFAINTAFYAAMIWMLFAVPAALRRRLRRSRGLCVKCAYDLRGRGRANTNDVCPECGQAGKSLRSSC